MSKLRFRGDTPFPNSTGKQNSWETVLRRILALVTLLLIGSHTVWSATPKWTIDKVVDNTTKCSDATNGYFNPSTEAPAINGEWVVFLDLGDNGCGVDGNQSIWSYNLVTKKLTKLVDTDTEVPVPKGVGKFTAFSYNYGSSINLQVNDGTVLFYGLDNGHNDSHTNCVGGLYTIPVTGGTIHRVVDYSMTLPGYGGYFCQLQTPNGLSFDRGMSISAGKIVFSAQADPGANSGVWWAPANVDATEADIHLVADGSTVYQSPFPAGCRPDISCWTIDQWGGGFIGGSTIAFTGGGWEPSGLFLNSIKDPILLSNYVLPGDKPHESYYPDGSSVYSGPVADGNNIFFLGEDLDFKACANGRRGIGAFAGVFETTLEGGTAKSIMNTCDKQPNGDELNAQNSFNYVVANEGTAIFQVADARTGDYVLDASVNGVVSQLIAPGDPLPSDASCDGAYHATGCATFIDPPGTGGMSGGRVVFGAEGGPGGWGDDGIWVASLPCADSVTRDVSITLGKLEYSSSTETWSQRATVENIGKETLDGPLSLVLKDLTSDARLTNPNGTTVCLAPRGSSFIDLSLPSNELSVGKSVEVTLEFSAPRTADIKFISEVAGAGAR